MFERVVNICEQVNLKLQTRRLSQQTQHPRLSLCKFNRGSSLAAQDNFLPRVTTPAHLCRMTTAGVKTIVPAADAIDAPFIKKPLSPTTSARDVGTKQVVAVGAPNPQKRIMTPMEDLMFVEQPTTFTEFPSTPMEDLTFVEQPTTFTEFPPTPMGPSPTPSEQPATGPTPTPSEEPATPMEHPTTPREGPAANHVYNGMSSRVYPQHYSEWSVMDDPYWISYATGIQNCSTSMQGASTYPISNVDFNYYSCAPDFQIELTNDPGVAINLEASLRSSEMPTDAEQRFSISLESSLRQSQLTDLERVSISLESSLFQSDEADGVDAIRKMVHPLSGERIADGPRYNPDVNVVDLGDATTIMLRNIPNRYTREMLLAEFHMNEVLESIDFFYLPIDLRFRRNVGYCFLNLVSCDAVHEFASIFDNAKLTQVPNSKSCLISRAKIQGKDANIEQYRNSAVITMHEKFHPILFENGQRISFPPPTKSKAELRAQQSEKTSVSTRVSKRSDYSLHSESKYLY